MLKFAYTRFWVPVFGRILSKLIPIIEGRNVQNTSTYDIDKESKTNNRYK